MGARGIKSKPTQLRVLHGDHPERINHDEPQAPAELPDPPDYISDDVREIWDYTVTQLWRMHLVSTADRDTLVAYCEAVVTHRRASEELKTASLLVLGMKGGQVRNPLVAMQRDSAILIRNLAREFGLTPSARSDIRMNPGAKNGAKGGADLLNA